MNQCSHQALLGIALAASLTSVPGIAQATQQPRVTAESARPALRVGTASGITLDGRVDEPAWLGADSIAQLTQIEPNEGTVPAGRTVIRVLAEAAAIIVGIRADDPEPDRITSFARDRDASLDNEDHIRLVLDTYLDGRSGYVFSVNPNGARYDALVANQGEGQTADWDALWEAATARTPAGWSVEIRIPVRSLLFRRGLTTWAFNVQRRIQRRLETDRWASPDRDVKFNLTSRAGLLTDLPSFDLGVGLSVRPSLTAGGGIPGPAGRWRDEADVSLDATQRIGANSLASLTLNTDFAETEVDTRRTNLTRFPLLFPEKRTFFLEGSDIFDFGLGLSDPYAFFSRRIGLLGGREVPLDVGLKLNGREGGTNAGALVVRTGELDTLGTDNTMAVVRVKQNVLRESSVGAMFTAGDAIGRGGSWTGGADLTYQTSHFRGDKNFLVGVWGLAMDRGGLDGRRHALGAKIDYPNDLWDVALTYRWVGENFDPSLGFVPRRAAQIVNFNVNFVPRPQRPILGLKVRSMLNEFLNTLVTDLDGKWESYRIFLAPINWRFESGDRFEFNYVPVGERLVESFEIADSVVIPPGSYHWKRWRLEHNFASKRKLSGQITWWFGDFYTGVLDEIAVTGAWKPSSLFILEFNATRNVARLAQGNFTQQVIGTRARVNVSPDLQVNSYLQYDNATHSFGTNTRVRWTFSPVGDAFLVYNHNVNQLRDVLDRHRGWRFASNQLLVKVQYAFRY
ncbi:MAG: DUF5916 domain-containing protein [Gemmatimonadaceae bacterium]